MKLKLFFQQTITLALLLLIGQTAFAQQTFTTVYDNDGKALRGAVRLIGNASDRPYNLDVGARPNCTPIVKWARLYWAGHVGGDTDQVTLTGPGGFRKAIHSTQGHKESNGVVWSDADYLIYRVYFPQSAGRDLDIEAALTAPVQRSAGWCQGCLVEEQILRLNMPIGQGIIPVMD